MCIRDSNITINPNSEAVYLNGEQIELTYLEYQILYLLLSNRKRIFSTQTLYESIWNEPYYYSANNTIMAVSYTHLFPPKKSWIK